VLNQGCGEALSADQIRCVRTTGELTCHVGGRVTHLAARQEPAKYIRSLVPQKAR
jgi:hypothetical protein